MKVLILSVTAGGGHNSTAKALKNALEKKGAEVSILDMYGAISLPIKWIIAKGYLISAKKLRGLYSFFYRVAEKRRANSYKISTSRIANRMMSKNIRKYIEDYDPDVIIFTHVFCGGILDVIKQRHGLKAKTVGIVTDFVMHPYWEETLRLDYIVTANELMLPSAVHKGFRKEQILPFGIPIQEKFSHSVSKEEARISLGLDKEKRTILLMSGSMGYSNIAKTVRAIDALDMDLQIICVCGSNEKAKEQIDNLHLKSKLLNYGFVNNVDVLMDAADCIITKPGGLTTSESLAKRLPMIICNPIPGQEDRNSEFLQNNGVAMKVSDTYSLAYAVFQLFYNPRKIELIQESIDMIRKPDSSEKVSEFVMQLALEKTK